uniref:cyanophycin synthetase n=1 Tax=Methylibium sp. TaxID=2067992 RepID=UPI0017DE798A
VRDRPRHYRVVVAYRSESVAQRAIEVALALVERLATGEAFALEPVLIELRSLAARAAIGPSTRAIVDAAEQRGIPITRLTESANLFQLGWGALQQRVQATITSQTNHVAVSIASDKELTKKLLAEAGLRVPRGQTVSSIEAAHQAMRRIGTPVVVKPLIGNHGKGVSTSVTNDALLVAGFERAQKFGRQILIEETIQGDDYRVLVIGKNLVAASHRVPPEVTGDGTSSVRALVEAVNRDPNRGDGHENILTKIRLDPAAAEELQRHGLDFDAVPAAGRTVRLRGNANLSTGGTAEDVTGRVHPDTACACVRAARKIGLDVAGIDIVCTDIAVPLEAQRGAIIEVNAAPGIRMHEHPSHGERHFVGRAIVDSLFPNDGDGRIPVVAVTGTNGKTTTTLAIAHVMQRLGRVTGVTTTEGIFIDGNPVVRGDCTGYWSARTVLTSPETEFAVLETARGGILKRGLAFDRCDVGVVLNIASDHLGQDGVHTVEDLARVKGLIVEAARTAVVLNADDAHCVAMARRARRGVEVVYFTLDASQPVFARHLARGSRGIHLQGGMLMWAERGHDVPLVAAARLPFTLRGKARHNIANAMAVFGALMALKVPRERILAGLLSFSSNESQNPLRLNVYRTAGVTLVVDYAHNAAAYAAVIETGRGLTRGRLIGVVAAPGDRQASDLAAIGRICGAGFDRLVVYEQDQKRGEVAGTTAAAIAEGAREARRMSAGPEAIVAEDRAEAVAIVLDVRAATRAALAIAAPGDMVIVGCASHLSDLRQALGEQAELSSIDVTAMDTPVDEPEAGPAPSRSEIATAA